MNKIFLILILLLTLNSCSLPLKLYKATAQRWCVGDIKGVNYHILLPSKTDYNHLTLDSILIDSSDIMVKQFNYSVIGKSNTFQQFQQNDTIIISYNASNQVNIESLVLYYTYKNKVYRLPIVHFIELHNLCP